MARDRPFWYLRRSPRQLRADVDEELRFHLEMRAAELTAAGLPEKEARVAAARQFGDLEYTRRYCRDQDARREVRMVWSLTLDELRQDLRQALRKLARNPGFALVALLVLGLGIGANTAIFSVVNTVLLRPLPFAYPDRLVMLFESFKDGPVPMFPVSAPDLLDFQRDQRSFEGLGAYQNKEYELGGQGTPERIVGARVTANLFPLLGVEPVLGRSFAPEEDEPGTGVVIITHRIWQERLGGDPGAIGRSLLVDRRPHTIVGVMPAGFQFPLPGGQFNARPAGVFVPMGFTPFERQGRTLMYNNSVIGRLKEGVTLDQARAELPLLVEQTLEGYPPIVRKNGFELEAVLVPLREVLSGDLRTPLLVMLGAVTLVLLIACANVAGLFLSRAAARDHEMSVRVALGASRSRLGRMLLTESLVLAVLSGAVGLALAWWGTSLLPSFLPESIPLPATALDTRVLAFVMGTSVVTALLCGLAPILSTRTVDLQSRMRQAAGTVTPSGGRLALQKGLVIATVTLSVVLLVTAGLLVRSFARLMAVDAGFRPDGVLTMSLRLPGGGFPTGEQVQAFYVDLVERTQSLPGVRTAGAATDLPFIRGERRVFTPDDSPVTVPDAARSVAQTWVVGDYLQAMGIRLVRGRLFTPEDRAGRERVAIVSESLARRFWPGADPIGQRIKWGVRESEAPWMTIVGVVADVRESSLDAEPWMHTYTPYLQVPPQVVADEIAGFGMLRALHLAIWTASDPAMLVEPVRREIRRLDPELAIANVQTMEQHVARAAAPQRASAALLALFAGAALLMAAVGLYGLLAYGVVQRQREIGIRMALGAARSQVIGMVLAQGVKVVAVGVALGVGAAFFATGALEALLYETAARDGWTFAVAPTVLIVVALAACGLPALRAARVDPVQALRSE
jgi:putative ABC transport system permease protein